MIMRLMLTLLVVPVLLNGCVSSGNVAPVAIAPAPPTTSGVKVPWQIAPATALTAQVHRDEPQLVDIPGWGRVKATRRVLASFPNELQSKPGRNRTVEACRRELQRASAAYGSATVSTASLGPDRRNRDGIYEGTVEVRIVYAGAGIPEVRQATMACFTRTDGTLVEAKPLFPINDETTG